MMEIAGVPLVKKAPVHQTLDPSAQRTLPPAPVVLLAEDDDDLRCAMEWTLNAMGFMVIACPDAERAFLAFRSHGHVDLLLTDFQMPGRSGVELARELTLLRPDLPVVINTGSILSEEIVQEITQRDWVHMSKPCNLTLLRSTLNRILDRQVTSYSPMEASV